MLAKSSLSQLVIVDMQTKLSAAMPQTDMQSAASRCGILVQAANLLEIPITCTEQYPHGLGETLPEIAQYLTQRKPIVKTAFSACAEPKFNPQLHRDRSHIILAGMEAHICVLQTALDLIDQGKQVFLVEDAIISRDKSNKDNAIHRLRDSGCIVTSTESVLFEWIGNANHESFKAFSKLIR